MTLPGFQLVDAVRSGCLADFQVALERGADPNAKSWDGKPSLIVAFQCGHPEFARRLIQRGADPHHIKDRRGDPLLIRAARTADIGMLSVLLEAGVDPDIKGQCRRTALHHAAKRGFDYVARQLVDTKASPAAKDCHRDTPLHLAARHGRRGVVRELLRVHANATTENDAGWTAVHEAVAAGHVEIARMLLDRSRASHSSDAFAQFVGVVLRVAEQRGQTALREALSDFLP